MRRMVIKRLLVSLALVYLALMGLLTLVQRRMLFPAPRNVVQPAVDTEALLRIEAPGGAVFTVYFAGHDAPTVVFFHGNGEQLADTVFLVRALHDMGLNAMSVEYPGYGLASDQTAGEEAIYDAAARALAYLEQTEGVAADQVVLMGHSLGTGVAVEMAHRGLGGRLVLLSAYTSIPDVARGMFFWLPLDWLIRDRFDSAEKAPEISMPTLLFHGARDQVIPARLGRRLAEQFPDATYVELERGHHNDLFVYFDREIFEGIQTLVGRGEPAVREVSP